MPKFNPTPSLPTWFTNMSPIGKLTAKDCGQLFNVTADWWNALSEQGKVPVADVRGNTIRNRQRPTKYWNKQTIVDFIEGNKRDRRA
jgi:hypothetical protein